MPPFGPTSAAEEDGVGLRALAQNFFRRRDPVLVQRAAAAEVEFSLELDPVVFFDDVEHFERFGDDFGPDVVAGEDEDFAAFGGGWVRCCGHDWVWEMGLRFGI